MGQRGIIMNVVYLNEQTKDYKSDAICRYKPDNSSLSSYSGCHFFCLEFF